MTPLMMQVAK